MKTYTIRCQRTGEILASNADYREAGHILLTHGDNEYQLRNSSNLFSYVLWRRSKAERFDNTIGAVKVSYAWYPTKIDTFECDPDKAVNEILRSVVQNHSWFNECILTEDCQHD